MRVLTFGSDCVERSGPVEGECRYAILYFTTKTAHGILAALSREREEEEGETLGFCESALKHATPRVSGKLLLCRSVHVDHHSAVHHIAFTSFAENTELHTIVQTTI